MLLFLFRGILTLQKGVSAKMEDKKVLTKEDIAEQLVSKARRKKGDAVRVVEAVFAEIAKGLVDPDFGSVKIAGFGQFSLVERPEREGVNPSSPKEKIRIPASKAVKFKPSKTLKDLVNEK